MIGTMKVRRSLGLHAWQVSRTVAYLLGGWDPNFVHDGQEQVRHRGFLRIREVTPTLKLAGGPTCEQARQVQVIVDIAVA
jgi:hypothetical protein